MCSKPQSVKHRVHVSLDADKGEFLGLPPEWAALLKASGISEEDALENRDKVINILDFEAKRAESVECGEPLRLLHRELPDQFELPQAGKFP